MNKSDLTGNATSIRRSYQRQNRRKNRTNISKPPLLLNVTPVALSTTIINSTNSSLIIEDSSVPINDILAPFSYLVQYKYSFLIGLIIFILLCVISIIFLIVLSRCPVIKRRRKNRNDKKLLKNIPDFLDNANQNQDEQSTLLDLNCANQDLNNPTTARSSGMLLADNTSATLSLDPMIEQKISNNNPSNSIPASTVADNTSVATLRGSLASSSSQQIPSMQVSTTTPTNNQSRNPITTDPIVSHENASGAIEQDDGIGDLDWNGIRPRFTKATNNSTSSLSGNRTSAAAIESIQRIARLQEDKEHKTLHGSASNLYEKEIRSEAEKSLVRNQTISQISLVSRTSEDSCY